MSLPSPAPSPNTDQGTVRSDVETQLLKLAQDLYEMEVCAGEVNQGMEDKVPEYLGKINQSFINLANMAPQVTDSVPRLVVENVDRYKNPHTYTKMTLSRATGENQYALGRVLGLESFRRQLESAVGEAFPGVPLPDRRHQPLPVEGAEQEDAMRNGVNGGHQQGRQNAQNGAMDVEPKTES